VSDRAAAEHGSALVTALVLIMIMLSVGLVTLAQVDTQQEQSGVERVRETTFGLAEGVLNAQIFVLSQRWPGRGASTPAAAEFVFAPCTQDSVSPNCPDAATIRRLFSSPDTEGSIAWRTEVRDNDHSVPLTCPSSPTSGSTFYSDASTAGQPAYDCNGDGRLWARVQATVRGRTRALVALVQIERDTHEMPRSVLFAGRLEIGNNANKVLVDAKADTALSAGITLRCTLPTDGPVCAGHQGASLDEIWSTTKLATQLNGTRPEIGYTGSRVLSDETLERLKRTAITNGTYFATCPTDASALTGAVVYVETCAGQNYTSNVVINSPDSPGALIIADGSMRFAGRSAFHGLIYHVNRSDSPGVLVELSGNNGGVSGGVFVEGQGAARINGSAFLSVDGRAFSTLRSYGSAGIIQNTWREIPSGA